MNKYHSILILCTVFTLNSYSQNSQFIWNRNTMGLSDNIQIEKKNSKCFLTISNSYSHKSLRKKIKPDECNKLFEFLDNYEFPYKWNSELRDTLRTYYDTKILPDTNWIYANGDSINLKKLPYTKHNEYYYEYDKKLKKCYCDFIRCHLFNDGSSYTGEYIKQDKKRTYNIYCMRLSPNDYKLNMILMDLIAKYDKGGKFMKLKKNVESDKPRNKNYPYNVVD